MSTWLSHELGGIDLLFTSPASDYFVDESSSDPQPNRTEEYVPLRSSDGARLAYSREAETALQLNIIALGDTLAAAKTNREALNLVLVAARNSRVTGDVVTYERQEDASEAEAEVWRVIGGKYRPVTAFAAGGRIFGLNGRYVALASITLALTKQ